MMYTRTHVHTITQCLPNRGIVEEHGWFDGYSAGQ